MSNNYWQVRNYVEKARQSQAAAQLITNIKPIRRTCGERELQRLSVEAVKAVEYDVSLNVVRRNVEEIRKVAQSYDIPSAPYAAPVQKRYRELMSEILDGKASQFQNQK